MYKTPKKERPALLTFQKLLLTVFCIFAAIGIVTFTAIKTEQILMDIISKNLNNPKKNISSFSSQKQKNTQPIYSNIPPKPSNKLLNIHKLQKHPEAVAEEVHKVSKSNSLVSKSDNISENTPKKTIYLTIDDGPSPETLKILDILEKERVKANFFVVGYNCIKYPHILKQISRKGHLIGNHSYSHKYEVIYKSFKNFVSDFNKAQETIYKITGKKPKYYRFPGGSLNRLSPQIKKFLDKNGIVYIDWNAITGDATKDSESFTYKDIIRKTFSTIQNKNYVVLLMHDGFTKKSTIKALPYIIKTLKSKGYIFETIDKMPKPLQFKTKAASFH